VAAIVFTTSACTSAKHTVHWTFDRKSVVNLNTKTGLCELGMSSGNSIMVEIATTVPPGGSYVPGYVELSDTLVLSEQRSDIASGDAIWRITVPSGTAVRFTSDSGSLSAVRTKVSLTANSASGSMTVRGLEGSFNLYTASGSIEMNDVVVTSDSGLGTESGNALLALAAAPAANLFMFTKTGSLRLSYSGHSLHGHFHLEAKAQGGRIQAPFPFARDELVDRNGTFYRVGTAERRGGGGSVSMLAQAGSVTLEP
jgi:hypothetical protein